MYIAADCVWIFAAKVDDTRSGPDRSHVFASLNQQQCFDRLIIGTIRQVCNEMGFPPMINHVLALYARVSRSLHIYGEPTGWIIAGNNSCGIPQGCPPAAMLCSVTSACWESLLTQRHPDIEAHSYLDDRLLHGGQQGAAAALDSTREIDDAFGSKLNDKKSKWGSHQIRPPQAPRQLRSLTFATTIKYMGIDIVFSPASRRPSCIQRPRSGAHSSLLFLLAREEL